MDEDGGVAERFRFDAMGALAALSLSFASVPASAPEVGVGDLLRPTHNRCRLLHR